MAFTEMHVKGSVILQLLGPEILTILEIKGQILHRVRLHLKVPSKDMELVKLYTNLDKQHVSWSVGTSL